tara:strand:+ start:4546 stop:5865 length:1320 start_codon:yes stop_codon:yes gene_type:complete
MATRTWLGNANPIKQVDTITIANTWATSDTCTITINSKDLVITVGSLTTTDQVATTIQEAIELTDESFTDAAASKNLTEGKSEFPELMEVDATVSGSVVTLTATRAGHPFTISVTATTAGSGTATKATATAATGPHHFNNADNWSAATVPVTNDTMVFDHNSNSNLLYGLNTGVGTLTVYVDKGFTGNIGLPSINRQNSSAIYSEYRDRHLATTYMTSYIGTGEGPMGGRVYLKSMTMTAHIHDTASADGQGNPAVQLMGTSNCTIDMDNGFAAVGLHAQDASVINGLEMVGGRLLVGAGCTSQSASANIRCSGGEIVIDEAFSTTTPFDLTMDGGTVDMRGGDPDAVVVRSGVLRWSTLTDQSGGSISLSGNGVIDFSANRSGVGQLAIQTVDRYSVNSRFVDPRGVCTAVVIDNNQISDLSGIIIGPNYRITRGSVA